MSYNVAAGVKGVKLSKAHRKDALTPMQVKHVLETLRGDTLFVTDTGLRGQCPC